ncbi:MAG: hypothetical protein A3J09_00340 [Candidatus Zambryskibacteria bacterium RIFCSPLOWO2_02_FULL_51_21]|uniref:Histidyl-tRNA synthetase n=1 Tax=Candidatus Zambryskibacteria bacterium RIFCSPHIGHO2_02_FULL_43_37 TaxID=1802749 RepID=A0A1G2TI82_9BACT|nr:MAG: hypothetical protein A2723_00340 [Candidatus Zambryskibacteria bacterium RIFCSPHIGHO2_01_FULL_52_18]OHA96903.1 MAG: hypothetical protein A3D49_02240 [Candidatus Zambryskibacteria bacterium RIFCSPHIGHO2_02_FULL_43_37]OHB07041.1 MAG: hypothetical protein A2944_02115 [Candidatus Zambryskibacteria bacterium RIFCSPLOWO2_01_FULL_52_12]OHB11015.1 MAG: hypothetical protein A3J09_00340 [Candidatus Zambryskibacteria bacterium RIFCSPLOWO2_02_FULL_51_21]
MLKEAAKPVWSLNEFDKPLLTASYFGFMPVAAPRISEADLEAVKHCGEHPYFDAAEKAALIRSYVDNNFASLSHPLALVYKRKAGRLPAGRQGYSLHFIGASTGIAEAALIRAALSILSEEGHKNLRVDINSIGDKDSIALYERELASYVRKFGGSLNPELKESLRQDPWNIFRREEEEIIQLRGAAPSSLSYLSSASRIHFKEVLEYLESLGVDFRLEPSLVGERNHCSHAIFAVKSIENEAEHVLATGYRYSRLTRKLGLKKEIPMAGVSIFSGVKDAARRIYKQLPKPKFYLVQLGREAKMKTLTLIENLRENHIPVHHFLGKDKLAAQLSSAEALRVSYLIIIGHKEALDGTATIRNIQTRAQDTIPISILPQYLKKISL